MGNTIIFFPRYTEKGPSSRYRIYNYLEYYKNNGYAVTTYPLFGDWYLDCIWNHKSKWRILPRIVFAYLKRFIILLLLPPRSIVYIGAELFPYFPYGLEKILIIKRIKYILEFDDAIFHYYDLNSRRIVRKLLGNKTIKAISTASCVITGCEYLTKYASRYSSSVIEIPTTIDAKKYINNELKLSGEFIIGWIGSFSQSEQIIIILPALKRFAAKYSYRLHLVGFDEMLEKNLQGIPYRIITWSEQIEVLEIRNFSVGIMPLDDTPFNNGKCALKLVQYMAIGIPTISSPLLSNVNINRGSGNLFATTQDEWYSAFAQVIQNQEKYKNIGLMNREIALQHYTVQANVNKHLNIFSRLYKDL